MSQFVTPLGICSQVFTNQSDFELDFQGNISYCAIECSGGTVSGSYNTTAAVSCVCPSLEDCIENCEIKRKNSRKNSPLRFTASCLAVAPLGANMQHGEGCSTGAVETSYCQNQCDSGYGYETPWTDVPSIQCVNGQWMPATLNDCVENNCPQPAPFGENMIRGTSNCDANTGNGLMCQHACVTGYAYPGSVDPPSITCQLGVWMPSSLGSCEPILCTAAAPIDQTTMATGTDCGADSAEGTVCQNTCNSGLEYTAGAGDNPPEVECRSGTWTPSSLDPCTDILCRTPAPLAENMIKGQTQCDVDSPLNSKCQHSCVNGFQYDGNSNPPPISCTDGFWYPASINPCTITTCANPAPIDAATMMIGQDCGANQEHGTVCQQTCNPGLEYTMDAGDNPPVVQCQSGTWSPSTLTPCTAKRCKVPAPFNANMVMGATNCNIDTSGNSTCQNTCITGFHYEGADNPPDITCFNGQWDPSSICPCSVTTCANSAPIDANTVMIGPNCEANQEHATLCQHTCNPGLEYTIDAGDNPPAVQCLFGTWSPAILTSCTGNNKIERDDSSMKAF